jgi:hypothetical protein
MTAGVIFAATSTTHKRAQSSNGATADAGSSSSLQGDSRLQPFPAEPYVAPAGTCQLDTESVGPEQQLGTPLNYHVWLNLSDPAFYTPGDATGRVAAGFAGRASILLHIEQVGQASAHGCHPIQRSAVCPKMLSMTSCTTTMTASSAGVRNVLRF